MFTVTNNKNIVSFYVLNHELCIVLSSSWNFIQFPKMDTKLLLLLGG